MMDAALCAQVDASRTALRKRCEPLAVEVSVDEGMPQAERFMQRDGHREDGDSSVLYSLFLSQASKWALPLPGAGCSVLSPARRHPRLVWTLSSSFESASVCFTLREAQVNQVATKALLPLSLSCAHQPLPQDMPPVDFGALAITITTTESHLAQPWYAPHPIRGPSASASSWSLSLLYPRRHQYRRRFCTTLEAANGAVPIGPSMHRCLHQDYVKLISRHASPTPHPSNQIDPASASAAPAARRLLLLPALCRSRAVDRASPQPFVQNPAAAPGPIADTTTTLIVERRLITTPSRTILHDTVFDPATLGPFLRTLLREPPKWTSQGAAEEANS